MEFIDCVYYINLDSRKDRCKEFEGEMNRLGVSPSKLHRIAAIPTPGFGILGCGLSHKKALETFYDSGKQYALIFEDDFMFDLDLNYCHFLLKHVFETKLDFDLIMLAGNVMKDQESESPFLRKVIDAQTASGFLIHREFAPKLIQALSESTKLLEEWWIEHHEKKHEYCNDIYWKKLQPDSKWYIFKPKLGLQRESYSDNEQKVTNYGV